MKKNRPVAQSFYKNRLTILSIGVILIMFTLVQIYYVDGVHPHKATQNQPGTLVGEGESVGQPQIGGEFTLVDETGATVTEQNLRGKFQLLTFGFTFCPDVCPTNLSRMAGVYNTLPETMQSMLGMVLVSVDPERDTPEVLKNYTDAFHPAIVGLTGTQNQLADMAKKYLVYFAKRGEGEDYLMDHSAYIYLFGPNGNYITHFGVHTTQAEMLNTLEKQLHQ